MKDKRFPIIILGGIILAGSLIFLYFNREKIFPQPKETETTTEPLLPEVKTTTVTTTVSGFTELPKKEESLGKITNYKVLQDFSGTYSILVLEGGIKEGTKLYMPYDGKISYQNQGGKIYNFQIYSSDGAKVITILGALKPKCKVTSVGFYGQVSFCENVKKGEVIAEVGKEELESTFPNFVFQIWGYNNNKSDLNLLYENLKTVFK